MGLTASAEERTISSYELCHRSGATYRQCEYWCRLGFFGPDVQGLGSGSARRFGPRDVTIATALRALSLVTNGGGKNEHGSPIARASDAFRRADGTPPRWLVVGAEHAEVGDRLEELMVEVGATAIVVDLVGQDRRMPGAEVEGLGGTGCPDHGGACDPSAGAATPLHRIEASPACASGDLARDEGARRESATAVGRH